MRSSLHHEVMHRLCMPHPHTARLITTVTALRSELFALLARVDEVSDLVERLTAGLHPPPTPHSDDHSPLRIDHPTFTVWWHDTPSELGATVGFRLLDRLARSANECVPFESLLDQLWDGRRSYSTLRSTVSRLRSRLDDDGLGDLARRIDGGVHGHYRLDLRPR